MIKEQVYRCADEILATGEKPSAQAISEMCELGVEQVTSYLAEWQEELPIRLRFDKSELYIADVPDSLSIAFGRIWRQAVEEANARLLSEQKSIGLNMEEARRMSDEALTGMQQRQQRLEQRLRDQHIKFEEHDSHAKSLEAEIAVLKTALASETTQRKQEELIRSNVEHELAHLRKTYDDTKRTFDQRIKDEQRHTLEAVSKADVDVRYYKNALEKLRDEVGKKEASLTKNIHDLKAEMAKKDVKLETQKTQIRSQEEELKQIKQDSSQQSRELARCNAALLAEVNKTKRHEDKMRELEAEIKRLHQRQASASGDWSQRENTIRGQMKEKEEELIRALSRISSLEKRIIAQDEEIRRLNTRL